ncbi:hypothetical protein SAMN05518849_13716 [Sphingobium sp. AP50]|nr:hypothetical protein SAMN05518849_13716 [Sphingobium sp. AP50]
MRQRPEHQYDRDRSSMFLKIEAFVLAILMIGATASGVYGML